jgi:hypothetical protein
LKTLRNNTNFFIDSQLQFEYNFNFGKKKNKYKIQILFERFTFKKITYIKIRNWKLVLLQGFLTLMELNYYNKEKMN